MSQNTNSDHNTFYLAPSSKIKKINKTNINSLQIWSFNIEGLTDLKLAELTHLIKLDSPDLVLIQETWLKQERYCDSDIEITGYNLYRKDRINGEHGGILFYVKNTIRSSLFDKNVKTSQHEVMWIRIPSSNKNIYIANVYKPPSSDNSIFDSLTSDIELIQTNKRKSKVFVLGDFNCHHDLWLGSMDVHGNPKTNDAGNACYSMCQLLGLTNLVKENTFVRNSGQAKSVLDLVLTDSPNLIKNMIIENPIGSSPHARISLKINLVPACHVIFKKTNWLYHKANWNAMRDQLRNSDWTLNDDINLTWEKYKTNIKSSMEKHIPKRVIKRNTNDKPWFTDVCALAHQRKVKAWQVLKSFPTDLNKNSYSKACKDAADTYKQAQKRYSEKIETDLKENGSNPKTWWQIVNHIVGKGGNSEIPSLNVNNIEYETALEKANILNNTFAEKSTINDNDRLPPLLSLKGDSFLNRIKIRLRVVRKKLQQQKTSKATGPDGIPARVLRECADVLSKPYSNLFNFSLKSSNIPNDWKCANVVPIYKSGERSDPNNYRPISLLSITSKVMESIINDYVKKHIYGSNLITKHQFGFRSNYSTFDLLTSATQQWENALNKGQEVKVAALDISRAFDRVWHKGLLSKLMALGIGGSVYRWIRSFLHNRSIKVIINGQQSTVSYINAGVPQGSVIGPTLFLIYINDLIDCVKNQVHLFADDTTLSAIIPNGMESKTQVINSFQSDLRAIEEWAEKWLVNFNAKKTQLMTISRKKSKSINDDITFVNESLIEVENIKLLGINITSSLDWSYHINHLAKRAGQRLGILRKARRILPPASISTLYKTKVRSIMEYCGPIWQNASKCALNKLDTIQRKVCHLIGKKQNVIPEYNINSLEQRRNVSGMCQIHRMVTGVAPPTVVELLPPFNQPNRISRYVNQSHHLQFEIKRSKSNHHMQSFMPHMTRLWNALPNDCLYSQNGDINSLQNFKVLINKHFLNLHKM